MYVKIRKKMRKKRKKKKRKRVKIRKMYPISELRERKAARRKKKT